MAHTVTASASERSVLLCVASYCSTRSDPRNKSRHASIFRYTTQSVRQGPAAAPAVRSRSLKAHRQTSTSWLMLIDIVGRGAGPWPGRTRDCETHTQSSEPTADRAVSHDSTLAHAVLCPALTHAAHPVHPVPARKSSVPPRPHEQLYTRNRTTNTQLRGTTRRDAAKYTHAEHRSLYSTHSFVGGLRATTRQDCTPHLTTCIARCLRP